MSYLHYAFLRDDCKLQKKKKKGYLSVLYIASGIVLIPYIGIGISRKN